MTTTRAQHHWEQLQKIPPEELLTYIDEVVLMEAEHVEMEDWFHEGAVFEDTSILLWTTTTKGDYVEISFNYGTATSVDLFPTPTQVH